MTSVLLPIRLFSFHVLSMAEVCRNPFWAYPTAYDHDKASNFAKLARHGSFLLLFVDFAAGGKQSSPQARMTGAIEHSPL